MACQCVFERASVSSRVCVDFSCVPRIEWTRVCVCECVCTTHTRTLETSKVPVVMLKICFVANVDFLCVTHSRVGPACPSESSPCVRACMRVPVPQSSKNINAIQCESVRVRASVRARVENLLLTPPRMKSDRRERHRVYGTNVRDMFNLFNARFVFTHTHTNTDTERAHMCVCVCCVYSLALYSLYTDTHCTRTCASA